MISIDQDPQILIGSWVLRVDNRSLSWLVCMPGVDDDETNNEVVMPVPNLSPNMVSNVVFAGAPCARTNIDDIIVSGIKQGKKLESKFCYSFKVVGPMYVMIMFVQLANLIVLFAGNKMSNVGGNNNGGSYNEYD